MIDANTMTTEKLIDVVSIKIADKHKLTQQASSRGMEVSDYIRHLIEADHAILKRQFEAMSPLFCEACKVGNVNDVPFGKRG